MDTKWHGIVCEVNGKYYPVIRTEKHIEPFGNKCADFLGNFEEVLEKVDDFIKKVTSPITTQTKSRSKKKKTTDHFRYRSKSIPAAKRFEFFEYLGRT